MFLKKITEKKFSSFLAMKCKQNNDFATLSLEQITSKKKIGEIGEKRRKIQNPVKIMHIQFILTFFPSDILYQED